MSNPSPRRVDQTALKVNQASIISLLLLAFLFNNWLIVALVAGVMVVGTAVPQLALFKQLYRRLLRPAGLLKSQVIPDNPEPHRFSQGFGGVVVSLAALALLLNYTVIGWALSWLVIVLASLNLFLGFCAGCFMYYQFNRLGIPGFTQRPLSQK